MTIEKELRFVLAPIRHVQFRDATGTPDGSWTISGYAAVFDVETKLYDGRYSRMLESIDPGFFNNTLAASPTVHLNLGHDMNRSVASTRVPMGEIGGLTLQADQHGLGFLARVDQRDPDAQAMAVKMERGIIDQASFAFTVARDEETATDEEDGTVTYSRRLLECNQLFDVCVLAQGAYPQTSAAVRSCGRMLAESRGIVTTGSADSSGSTSINPGGGAESHQPGDGGGFDKSKAADAARAALARIEHPLRGAG